MPNRKFFCILFSLLVFGSASAYGGAFKYYFASHPKDFIDEQSVIGFFRTHVVANKETFFDIARKYGLGFNEIQIYYPQVDPWVLFSGQKLSLPSLWVLPKTRYQDIVINIPELRLYRFFPKINMVKTYPVGIGRQGWETPQGTYSVVELEVDPTWTIPKSLRKDNGITIVPPGPDNPLGKYWIGLSHRGIGIHGTNFAWGVGLLVSHGCIRLYPEHIQQLYREVSVGTRVEIIYEPVKVGVKDHDIFIEVHPDIYGKIGDIKEFTHQRLNDLGVGNYICPKMVNAALVKQNGVPTQIGTIEKGGGDFLAKRAVKRFCRMDYSN